MIPEDSFQIRSEEVEDIVTTPPKWIIRSGITVIAFIFICLISVSWFISYPDTITGSTIITTSQLSTTIIAPANNKVTSIHFKDGQKVNKGDVLMKFENIVDSTSIHQLVQYMEKVQEWIKNDFNVYLDVWTPDRGVLGDFQSDLNVLVSTIRSYNLYIGSSGYTKKTECLVREKETLKSGFEYILKQKEIEERKLELATEKFEGEKKLYSRNSITKHDFMDEEMKLLIQQEQTNGVYTTIVENKIRISRIDNELNDLKLQNDIQILEYKNTIESQLNILQNKLASFEKQCIISAPISGKVYFLKKIYPFEYINAGTPLIFIQPDSIHLTGRIFLSSDNLGKIEIGQEVNIFLNEFPKEEYGILKGRVTNISELPVDSLYVIDYELINGLTTNYHQDLRIRPEMKGKADIITKKKNLFQRFFEKIFKFKK